MALFNFFGNNKDSNTKKTGLNISHDTQDYVPFKHIYKNGLFESEDGTFAKVYSFEDIPFVTKSYMEQNEIYEHYQAFLNTIPDTYNASFNIIKLDEGRFNKQADKVKISKSEFTELNNEINNFIQEKFDSINGNLAMKKLFVISTSEFDNPVTASEEIDKIMGGINRAFKKIVNSGFEELTVDEVLFYLFVVFNGTNELYDFYEGENGKKTINADYIKKNLLNYRDFVAPQNISYNDKQLVFNNERVCRSFYVGHYPNNINNEFFLDLLNLPFEHLVTLHIKNIPSDIVRKMLHDRILDIEADIAKRTKNDPMAFIPLDLQNQKDSALEMQQNILTRDQKLFYTGIDVLCIGNDEKDLEAKCTQLTNISKGIDIKFVPYYARQKDGFQSTLPISGKNKFEKRTMMTEELGTLLPFEEGSYADTNGICYGSNPINKQPIVYNRLNKQNYNGLIFGSSGSGKSFAVKWEIINAINQSLINNTNIIIIDPDGEYKEITRQFGGQVIEISPQTTNYLNILDLNIDDYDTELPDKINFLCGIVETIYQAPLTPQMKSIIERSAREIYKPYISYLQDNGLKEDKYNCPTLQNLYENILELRTPDAGMITSILEPYVTGRFDLFSKKSNVDMSAKLICFDISNVGDMLKELSLKVCLQICWNKIIENHQSNIWTRLYIDEFHLLLHSPYASSFLLSIWKRCRKFQGSPTGITQNIEDLLRYEDSKLIVNNTSFVNMLNCSTMDVMYLEALFNLNENQSSYLTEKGVGKGLLYTAKGIIRYENLIPKTYKFYSYLTTDANDKK